MAQATSSRPDREPALLDGTQLGGDDEDWESRDEKEALAQRNELRGFLDLPIEVGVQLGRRHITFREILDLRVGSVIRMERSAGENVDLLLERSPVGRGEIVVIEDMVGLRITDLAYPKAAVSEGGGEMIEPLGALALVFGLLGGLLLLVRKLSGVASANGRHLKVIETATLSPGRTVALVQVAGRCLLLGSTGERIERLAEFAVGELPVVGEGDARVGRTIALEASAPNDGGGSVVCLRHECGIVGWFGSSPFAGLPRRAPRRRQARPRVR